MKSSPLKILFRDAHYLAVDKPPGLPTHATVDARREDLLTLLQRQEGETLGLHHRLDRDTSGVLLLARTPEGNRALAQVFAGRELEKTYLGVVEDQSGLHYLRPETAQGIFLNFTNVVTSARRKPPSLERAHASYGFLITIVCSRSAPTLSSHAGQPTASSTAFT